VHVNIDDFRAQRWVGPAPNVSARQHQLNEQLKSAIEDYDADRVREALSAGANARAEFPAVPADHDTIELSFAALTLNQFERQADGREDVHGPGSGEVFSLLLEHGMDQYHARTVFRIACELQDPDLLKVANQVYSKASGRNALDHEVSWVESYPPGWATALVEAGASLNGVQALGQGRPVLKQLMMGMISGSHQHLFQDTAVELVRLGAYLTPSDFTDHETFPQSFKERLLHAQANVQRQEIHAELAKAWAPLDGESRITGQLSECALRQEPTAQRRRM
jgi:hypothetical protein